MEEKEVLANVSNSILEEPIKIEIDIVCKTWFTAVLIKCKLIKPKKTFLIKPLTLGSLVKISKELLGINLAEFDNQNLLESNYKLIENHSNKLAKVIGIAVVNSRDDPPKKLVDFFLNNLTSKELFTVATIVLKQMDIQSFMLSIISIKGTNILQSGMSLKPGETIAFGKL